MKSISSYINESFEKSASSDFKEQVKYSNEDMKKWIDAAKDLYEVAHYDEADGKGYNTLVIYKKLNKKDKWGCDIEHIATYIVDKEILFTDDTTLFGN